MTTHLLAHTPQIMFHTIPHHPQLTNVNLNYILCPALVDPFNGPYYRTAAVFHQASCLLTLGKLYTLAVKLVFKLLPVYKPALVLK